MEAKTKKIIAIVAAIVFGLIEIIVVWKFTALTGVVSSIIGVLSTALISAGINLDVSGK
jgi:hypothetical protein